MIKDISQICVTIGIPFYNSEKTIGDAIRSVFAQTHQNWKLILINDGSTDNAGEWVSRIKDDRVTYIEAKNQGYLYWLNYIISIADTRYLARMDGDDIMHPERIEKQLRFLIEHPEVDIIDSAIFTNDLDSNPVGVRRMNDINLSPKALLNDAVLNHPAVMGKTEWFSKNPYNQEYYRAEDQELWCRTAHHSVFARIKEPLLIYREGRVKISNYALSIKSNKKIIRTYGPRFLSRLTILFLLAKADVKLLTYKLLGIFNLQDIISSRRNKVMKEEDRWQYEKILSTVRKTAVPGLD